MRPLTLKVLALLASATVVSVAGAASAAPGDAPPRAERHQMEHRAPHAGDHHRAPGHATAPRHKGGPHAAGHHGPRAHQGPKAAHRDHRHGDHDYGRHQAHRDGHRNGGHPGMARGDAGPGPLRL
ncbi:hypothetical protein [Xanthobacter sp. ZOL 2024]